MSALQGVYVCNFKDAQKAANRVYLTVLNESTDRIVEIVHAEIHQGNAGAVVGSVRNYRLMGITAHADGIVNDFQRLDTDQAPIPSGAGATRRASRAGAGEGNVAPTVSLDPSEVALGMTAIGEDEHGGSPGGILFSEKWVGTPIRLHPNQGVAIVQDSAPGIGYLNGLIYIRVR